jgi:hypothetical protein
MSIRTATLLLALGMSHGTLAQPASATAQPDAAIEDVIVVNGRRYPGQLRLQMLDAERAVYDLFNRLNDNPEFDISCSRQRVTGTQLPSQVCQPEFEREALALEGQDYLAAYRSFLDPSNLDYSPPQMGATTLVIPVKQRSLARKLKAAAEESPEFRDALVSYVQTKLRYREATSMLNE